MAVPDDLTELRPLTLGELRSVQLQILRQVDHFCREHDVPYFLAWGTLLGARRHGGYIPWDDDVDLMMFRQDYDRFEREFGGSTAGAGLSVGSAHRHTAW